MISVILGDTYTWRYESILNLIAQTLQDQLSVANSLVNNPVQLITFVKAGDSNPPKRKHQATSNILSGTNDWNIIVDLENQNYIFPPEIYNISERPDIVIWSYKLKKVIMIELTCSSKEGFTAAKNRKTGKYMPLLQNISRKSNWTCFAYNRDGS